MNRLFHPDKKLPPGFENYSKKIMEAYKRLTEFRHLIEWHGPIHKDVNKPIENEQKEQQWQQTEQEERYFVERQKQKLKEQKTMEQENNKRNRDEEFKQYCDELKQKYKKPVPSTSDAAADKTSSDNPKMSDCSSDAAANGTRSNSQRAP